MSAVWRMASQKNGWWVPVVLAGIAIAGCASSPKTPPPAAAPAPVPALDASYDWHTLVIAPFGSRMKDIHFTLHEVLLFRDESRPAASAAADDAECYAIEGTTPQFVLHPTSEYLLCFRHDRLARIEATVQLPSEQAAQTFADACGLWLKNATTKVDVASATAATDSCNGLQGAVTYSARLDSGEPAPVLSIKLNAAEAALER